MNFHPAQYLGQRLPDLVHGLAAVDPAALDRDERVELFSPLVEDAVSCRPTTLMQNTIQSANLPPNHPDVDLPGLTLETYLGGGGQGWVYLARVLDTDCTVAVKVLREDPVNRKAALREAEFCARVRHPNVLRVFRTEEAGAFRVVIMELVQGEELHRQLLNDDQVRNCFGRLADALHALREKHIVHCDIKPSNILLRQRDQSPVLVDFGVAQDLNDTAPLSGISGTPYFMAAEVFRDNRPNAAWDAYSLGVTASMLLAGRISGFPTFSEIRAAKLSGKFDESLRQTVENIKDAELRDWISDLLGPVQERRLGALEAARRWAVNVDLSRN
jgi:serine/threonine protein kinase